MIPKINFFEYFPRAKWRRQEKLDDQSSFRGLGKSLKIVSINQNQYLLIYSKIDGKSYDINCAISSASSSSSQQRSNNANFIAVNSNAPTTSSSSESSKVSINSSAFSEDHSETLVGGSEQQSSTNPFSSNLFVPSFSSPIISTPISSINSWLSAASSMQAATNFNGGYHSTMPNTPSSSSSLTFSQTSTIFTPTTASASSSLTPFPIFNGTFLYGYSNYLPFHHNQHLQQQKTRNKYPSSIKSENSLTDKINDESKQVKKDIVDFEHSGQKSEPNSSKKAETAPLNLSKASFQLSNDEINGILFQTTINGAQLNKFERRSCKKSVPKAVNLSNDSAGNEIDDDAIGDADSFDQSKPSSPELSKQQFGGDLLSLSTKSTTLNISGPESSLAYAKNISSSLTPTTNLS